MSKINHGKRMVPEYLIAKLETLEPGGDYTAGAGISIEDGVLSVDYGTGITVDDGTLVVDTSVIASKSDIITSYNDLTDKPTIPTVTNSITQGSTDAVTSGAVYSAIGDIESLLAAI